MAVLSLLAFCTFIGVAYLALINSLYYACFVEDLCALAPAVKAGAYSVSKITREQYMKRLNWLKEGLRYSCLCTKNERQKTAYSRVSNILENLRLDRADGTLREQPFLVVLTGYPGSGKTGVAMRIAAEIMRRKYDKFLPCDVVTLNETDEFQSEYRTNHKVVIFDDLGAEVPSVEGGNPWRKVIDFVNNIRKTSLNPNLELKGNVYIQPEVVIITTNLRDDMYTSQYLNCPSAIMRRINHAVYLDSDHVKCKLLHKYDRGDEKSIRAYNYFTTLANKVSHEELVISEMISRMADSYFDFSFHQEDHVRSVNSIFDQEEELPNAWQCLWQDFQSTFMRPRQRLPVCQSGKTVPTIFTSDEGSIDSNSTDRPTVHYILDGVMSLHRACYLLATMNDTHLYRVFGSFLWCSPTNEIILFPGSNPPIEDYSMWDKVISFTITKEDLQCWYDSKRNLTPDDYTRVECPYYEGEIHRFRSFLYNLNGNETFNVRAKTFKDYLVNCQRKIPEMGGTGNMPISPSSLYAYQTLRRAWHFGAKILGVEVCRNGLTFDAAFEIGDNLVIVEAKTKENPATQLKRNMRSIATDDSPVIGIGINIYGYRVYYTHGADIVAVENATRICSAVFQTLNKYGKHYRFAFPYSSYTQHDVEYPPPPSVVT